MTPSPVLKRGLSECSVEFWNFIRVGAGLPQLPQLPRPQRISRNVDGADNPPAGFGVTSANPTSSVDDHDRQIECRRVSVAGFVLGLVATVLAVSSLTWQFFVLRKRPEPKLTPVIGLLTPGGLVTSDAGNDAGESLENAAAQFPEGRFVIGVKVVNTGRSPLQVARWAIRIDPDGTSLQPTQASGAEVPHDIPVGETAVLLTELQHVQRFVSAAKGAASQPPRIVLTVSSGARTYVTRPIAPGQLSLGSV